MEISFNKFMRGYKLILDKDEKEIIKCNMCGQKITEGYLCESRKILICKKCHPNFSWKQCKFDSDGAHKHLHIIEV